MKIIQPAHNKIATPVKNWKAIKQDANKLRTLIHSDDFSGGYKQAYAISHAQVSNSPQNFFVVNDEIKEETFNKIFGHWCIINPKIIHTDDPVIHKEACMSFPWRKDKGIERFNEIKVKYYTPSWFGILRRRTRKLKGIPAFIVQHETEHARGVNMYGMYQKN